MGKGTAYSETENKFLLTEAMHCNISVAHIAELMIRSMSCLHIENSEDEWTNCNIIYTENYRHVLDLIPCK